MVNIHNYAVFSQNYIALKIIGLLHLGPKSCIKKCTTVIWFVTSHVDLCFVQSAAGFVCYR
jgi:hypothetical protein